MRFKLHIRDDGTVNWEGVDTGVTTVMSFNPIAKLVALKIAWHTTRSGSGPLYGPAHYAVYRYEVDQKFPAGFCGARSPGIIIIVDELFGELNWNVRSKK